MFVSFSPPSRRDEREFSSFHLLIASSLPLLQGKEWRHPDHRFFSKDKSLESRTEAQEAIDEEEEREAKVPAPSIP